MPSAVRLNVFWNEVVQPQEASLQGGALALLTTPSHKHSLLTWCQPHHSALNTQQKSTKAAPATIDNNSSFWRLLFQFSVLVTPLSFTPEAYGEAQHHSHLQGAF